MLRQWVLIRRRVRVLNRGNRETFQIDGAILRPELEPVVEVEQAFVGALHENFVPAHTLRLREREGGRFPVKQRSLELCNRRVSCFLTTLQKPCIRFRIMTSPPYSCYTCSLSITSGGSLCSLSRSAGKPSQLATETAVAKGEADTVFHEATPSPQGNGAWKAGYR